jgi:hypothetical protein
MPMQYREASGLDRGLTRKRRDPNAFGVNATIGS